MVEFSGINSSSSSSRGSSSSGSLYSSRASSRTPLGDVRVYTQGEVDLHLAKHAAEDRRWMCRMGVAVVVILAAVILRAAFKDSPINGLK